MAMRNTKLVGAIGLLLGLTLFFGGMLSARLLSQLDTVASRPSAQNEGLSIGGAVQIDAYHADGTKFASWSGHNALGAAAINGIAACLPGLDTTPAYYNGCSTFMNKIYVGTRNGPICCVTDGANATSTLLPNACDPNTGSNPCNGWKSSATIDIVGTYTLSLAAGIHGTSGAAFDWIDVNPSFAVSPGDRVIVTITFTVN